MKAKVSIILLGIIICSFAETNGQSYIPFIDTAKHWNVMITYSDGGSPSSKSTIQYWFSENDTIINDTSYRKVMSSGDHFFYPPGVSGYIREDTATRKVFFRNLDSSFFPSGDQLLYDFSAVSGDTIEVFGHLACGWAPDQNRYVVTSVGDTTLMDNRVKKTWTLEALDENANPIDFWIEDIGSLNGVLYPGCYMFGTVSFRLDLLCYFESGESIYISEEDSCFVDWSTGIKKIQYPVIKVYPNPASEIIVLELPQDYKVDGEYTIFDIKGTIILKGKLENNIVTINALAQGYYFVRVIADKGVINGKFVKH